MMDSQQFTVGADVVDSDGEKVGTVSEHGVQQGALVVHHGLLRHDVYVPLKDIEGADSSGTVRLNVPKDDLGQDRYAQPPAAGTAPMGTMASMGAMGISGAANAAESGVERAEFEPGESVETQGRGPLIVDDETRG